MRHKSDYKDTYIGILALIYVFVRLSYTMQRHVNQNVTLVCVFSLPAGY